MRFELKAALLRADRQPEPEHPVVDVACVTDEEHLLYEVLGADLTSYADLRSGAARLREINHALAVGADRLCLVLAGPPVEEWAPATVHESSASTSCGVLRSGAGAARTSPPPWETAWCEAAGCVSGRV
ncbi:hypothetical protein [Streptomyces sp. CB00316]|uniref:hypothetical protein n=1 Tax=Streptomyces sp. CB00316 TaxID=1703932 RepID=UPI000AEFEB8E|nr:hypothetical protein [Streptomyces sp. CB00316]